MKAPYRSEVEALRERKESLEAEAARLRVQTTELDALRGREKEIEAELASIEGRLGLRSLPLLDQVRIASPCNAKWDDMLGDDRARFCLSCEKNVFDVSAMPREEAESFLRQRAGQNLCIRYYRRADGTILTDDCPVGVKKKRRRRLALAVAGASAVSLAGAAALFDHITRRPAMGVMAPLPENAKVHYPPPPTAEPDEVQGQMPMGDWAGTEVEPVRPPPPVEGKGRIGVKR